MTGDGVKILVANVRPQDLGKKVFPGGVEDFKFFMGNGETWFRDVPELGDVVKKDVIVKRVDMHELYDVFARHILADNSPDSLQLHGRRDAIHRHELEQYFDPYYLESGYIDRDDSRYERFKEEFDRNIKTVNGMVYFSEHFVPVYEEKRWSGEHKKVIRFSGVPIRYSIMPRITQITEFCTEDLAHIFKDHLGQIDITEDFEEGTGENTYDRIRCALRREGMTNYWQVICTPDEQFRKIKGIGHGSYREFQMQIFLRRGLNLGLFPQEYRDR